MTNNMIELLRWDEMPPELHTELADWYQALILGHREYDHVKAWGAVEMLVLQRENGQWVSSIELLRRSITVGGIPVEVGGISGVITHPDQRGRGLASQNLRRGMDFMREEWRVPFGVLMCKKGLMPFYRSLGWQAVEDQVVFEGGTFDRLRVQAMIFPFSAAIWPGGTIDMCGLPW